MRLALTGLGYFTVAAIATVVGFVVVVVHALIIGWDE